MASKFIFFYALVTLAFAEDAKESNEEQRDDKAKPKRGLYGLGYGFNNIDSFDTPEISSYHLSEPSTHVNTVITKEVHVPHPVAVPVEKHVPYPVKVPFAVPVDRPYPVHVPKPYPVEVTKHIPVPVDRPVPYPVKVPVKELVFKHVPVPYAQPVFLEKYEHPLVLNKYSSLSSWK